MDAKRLKPGTPCWLTKTVPENMGKVVEVLAFVTTMETMGDLYRVKCKDVVYTQLTAFGSHGNYALSKKEPVHEMNALRQQLIPIIDPDKSTSDEDEEQHLQWKKYEFPEV